MLEYFGNSGINTYSNVINADGQIIHALNVYSPGQGIIAKRPGYTSFGTSLGTQVNSIFDFPFQNNTTQYLYAYAGSLLNYSVQGTGAWTIAGGGTLANNAHIGNDVFNNILSIGDGVNPLKTSSNGTTFTAPGSAPVAQYISNFHNRSYTTDGTSSIINYSVANDPTNWQNSGTSDSSLITAVSAGACTNIFTSGDRLIIPKNWGNMFSWDDTSLVDLSTVFGPGMPWSIKAIDSMSFYVNNLGVFSFDGATRTLLSNPVQRQFYNQHDTGMGAAILGTAGCSATYYWNYLVTQGTITDDFTGRQIKDSILLYDYQKNGFYNWQFADFPTAMNGYIDTNNSQQLMFGNSSGQVFKLSRTATSDNGAAIPSELVLLFSYNSQGENITRSSAQVIDGTGWEKKWNWGRFFFMPGNEVNIQFAFSNSLQYQHLKWSEAINTKDRVGGFYQVSDGVVEIRFPNDPNNLPRSRFLFVRIYESSDNSSWQYMGATIDAVPQIIT